ITARKNIFRASRRARRPERFSRRAVTPISHGCNPRSCNPVCIAGGAMNTVFAAEDAGTRPAARDREAWTLFWADAAQSRCAAGAPEIWQALMRHWWAFARSLPRGARVLDLGCGAGAVGRMLLAVRDDLRITGIDAARIPPST